MEENTVQTNPTTEVDTDTQEWDNALSELYPSVEEPTKPEPGDTVEPSEVEVEPPKEEPKVDEPAEQEKKPEQAEQPQVDQVAKAIREERMLRREMVEGEKAIRDDVKEQMFKGKIEGQMLDADGDPINSVQDIMGLVNPKTGEAFTEEEATLAWLDWSKKMAERRDQIEAQIDAITEVNVSLKDEADAIQEEFGEFLKANPKIADIVWEQYSATLKHDPETDIIIEAPVSLEKFYRSMLMPYRELAKSMEQKAEVVEAKDKEIEKLQTRNDRADIVGHKGEDNMSNDEREWSDVMKEYYN